MKFSYNYITNFYLHYGIHEMADLFLDMSLIKYIIQNEYSTKNLISCLKFAVVFPCENRLCNQIMILLRGKRDTTIFDKFLIFQVKKIRLLRQSTSSIQSSEQLQEISRLSSTTEMKVSNFFKRRTANCGVLFDIHKYVSKTHSLFMESLISYANSTVFRDAYVNFLIESEADFTGAILETRRRDLIESGMTYAKDLCFKAFVVAYPEYLKEQILTIKRQFIINMKNDGSNSNNENKRSQSTSDELELKVEEEIGKNIIKQARIRIAMQNAIRGKKANNSKILLIFLIVTLIASIALYSAIFGIMYGYFDNRYDATKRSMKCANVLMYFATTNLANLLQWGNITTHFVAGVNREKQWYTHESPYIGFLDYDLTYDKNALAFKDKAQYTYVDLTSDFSDFALNSADRASVQEMSAPLVDPKVEVTLCKNGSPEKTIHTGLGMAMTFLYTAQTILSNNRDYFSWFNSSDEFCHVTSVGSSISDSLIEFRMGIVNDEIKTAQKVKLFINEFMIIVSVVFGLYSIGVFLVISFMFLKEINLFVERILGFEKSVLEAASCTLHKNEKDDQMRTDINQNQDKYSNFNIYMYNSIVIILVFGVIALYIVDMLQAETLNKRLEYTTQWSLKSSVRMPYALISLHSLLMALFTSGKQKMEINITTAAKQIKIWSTNIETIIENSDFLIQGDSNIEGIIGFDPVIDDITTKSQCDPDPGNVSMHETYRCNSLNQLYYYYYSLSNDIIEEIDKYDGRIFGKMPGEIPHLVLNHCIPDSVKLNERFDQLVLSFLNDFKTLHTLFFILEIIMIILIFLFGFLLWQHLNNAFSTALLLLRRISPVAVVNNPKILRYILDISMKDHSTEMTTSESIVKNSLSGIICTAQNGSIEIINKSITTILGFSPDQVLGQSIGALFDEESSNIVRQKLELMILKQSALYYEDHVICLDDSNVSVPCQMIIIGVENDEKKLSFVIVLNEESALIEQQETAEKAKARSEKLLYNILPREIVIRINSGEKDISFSVPMATISFIDFVKFSEYSSSLTPKEIMGNLSTFFGAFDEILSKYPMLMKIKLIGDVYMCAGGLFNPDAPPNAHAEQMVNFDIEVLQAIDDLNMKLSTLLSVRIGINTGGPLIAGVLGTDKPVFDIIGDPINIASRLQSTDIPGQIQISQAVHDLICQGDFNIEPRGEVFLKGKGKAQVYLVKPQTVLAFQLSAEMHNSTSSFVNNSAPNIQ
ncbi:Adenylate and Guanylate cyclase catalytic domain containing protein [Tritrichomonas foetus]|uniref:Adenylate and Guanylate cyclase catalytic domain containing protein n=1 Tax=Tritrichomonas foetus TaxID=1144522 RepID=A0A1J4KLI9_9EUKA|nr:Adenylate and Guanylate cyclase catalytic domain containing protein [Tritrichomonas foetus]|eukprot:OHT12083.1 Adenylate and Guanylate cyclase catalytic domain containing protein [Tritrichomonas foetus]